MSEQTFHILLVEDEGAHVELVLQAFESHADKFRLTVADTLEQARDFLGKSPPDLVITDLHLPDGKGTELLPGNGGNRQFPFIVMTAHGDELVAVNAMKAGALDYVVKSEVTIADMSHIAARAIREWTHIADRKRMVEELKKANQKILEQQKAVIAEERLKVLLQMAGATAHEVNQPLTALLGNIELMGMNQQNPEKLAYHMAGVKEAGQRICNIVEKIQTLRHYETKPYLSQSIINFDQKIRILSVEGPDDDFETINAILRDHNQVHLSRARSIKEAMEVLERSQFDLIILDYFLSDGNGLDFLRIMGREILEIPVVVITEQGDEVIASQVIQAGAYDYLTKGKISHKSISRIILNTMEKFRLKREIEEARKKIAAISNRDQLTGLYNRRYFMEALKQAISRAKWNKTELVLCIIGLDNFKRLNSSYGYPAGDMVLSEISKRLQKFIRQIDLVCRYGGEELAVILPSIEPEKARIFCEKFRERMAGHLFKYDKSQFYITLSVGITSYQRAADQFPIEFVEAANQALSQAKVAGMNRVVEYAHGIRGHKPKLGQILVSEGYITEGELRKALSEQKLRLGEVLVQASHITAQQLNQALDYQKNVSMKLGKILKDLGYSTTQDINWALSRMKGKLGEILREKGLLTSYELNSVLALQGHVPTPI